MVEEDEEVESKDGAATVALGVEREPLPRRGRFEGRNGALSLLLVVVVAFLLSFLDDDLLSSLDTTKVVLMVEEEEEVEVKVEVE